MNPRVGWNTLVERRPWLARAMLVACSLSLLATSPDDDGGYGAMPFEKSSPAPACTLTAETSSCAYLVTITHDPPESDQPFFTTGAHASIAGTITASGVNGDVPFVAVRVASVEGSDADEMNALTQFSSARSLAFSGGCHVTDMSSPCRSVFTVSFSRKDSGDRGGTVSVGWGLELRAYASSGMPLESGGLLPWRVEYTPQ